MTEAMNYRPNTVEDLTDTELEEIKYLAAQSNGRFNLICNLYKIEQDTLRKILKG